MASYETRKISLHAIACFLVTGIILLAGLWPFTVNPKNKVEWFNNANGLRFYGQSMVASQQPLQFTQTDHGTTSLTIELFVRPNKESNNTVTSILTLYDRVLEQFMIGHWRTHLAVRVRTPVAENHRGYREIGLPNVLPKNRLQLFTIVSEQEKTDIYINGKLKEHLPGFSLIPDDRDISGRLILGNSPTGNHSWNGSLLGLAIYGRSLTNKEVRDHYRKWKKHDYTAPGETTTAIRKSPLNQPGRLSSPKSPPSWGEDEGEGQTGKRARSLNPSRPSRLRGSIAPVALYFFNERSGGMIFDHSGNQNHLLLPSTFKPLQRVVLGLPERSQWFSRGNLVDVAVNIFGFSPFGFFLALWLHQKKGLPVKHAVLITIFLGFCLSLAIELAQSHLPTRDSSLLDLAFNTLGAALGIALAAAVRLRP